MAYGYALDVFEVGRARPHRALRRDGRPLRAAVVRHGCGRRRRDDGERPRRARAERAVRAGCGARALAGEELPAVPPAPDPLVTPLAGRARRPVRGRRTATRSSLKDEDGRLVMASGAGRCHARAARGPLGVGGRDGRAFAVPDPGTGPVRARRRAGRTTARCRPSPTGPPLPGRRRSPRPEAAPPSGAHAHRGHVPHLEPLGAGLPRVPARRPAVARVARPRAAHPARRRRVAGRRRAQPRPRSVRHVVDGGAQRACTTRCPTSAASSTDVGHGGTRPPMFA